MMKKLLLFALIILLACSKDENDFIEETNPNNNTEDTYIRLSFSEINAESEEGEKTLKITSNSNWSVKDKPTWIQLSLNSGTGNKDLTINWSKNNMANKRIGEILFKADEIEKKIKFTQDGFPLELIDYSGKNGKIKMSEPKFLLFNKPISLNSITSGEETISFYIGEVDVEYFDNNRGVKFNIGPSDLGREYKYKFSVVDNDGNNLNDMVTLPFYTEKIILPGRIRKMILDDENNLWVLTLNQWTTFQDVDRIYKFKTSDGEIVEELSFNLDIANYQSYIGGDFFINPYNDLLYIPDYIGNEIEVYNKSGDLIKKIEIVSDELDHPQYPKIHPISIGFNNSGKGILALGNPGSSGLRWKFIDSSQNDLITSPEQDYSNFYQNYVSFELNFDNTKLFTVGNNRSSSITVYDNSGNFNEIIKLSDYYDAADMSHLEPNRLNNKIYVNGLYNQQILSTDGSYHSSQSYSQGFLADFSYKDNHENIVYALSPDSNPYLQLMDYNSQENIFAYRAAYFLNWTNARNISTTTDNKFVILYSDHVNNSTISSQIVFFDTEMFNMN